MISHILLPTDGSELAAAAAQEAAYLSGKTGSKVTLLHVVERFSLPGLIRNDDRYKVEIDKQMEDSGHAILRMTQRPFLDQEIAVNLELRKGRPADVIVEAVRDLGVDLVVLADKGRGLVSKVLLGSVTQEVVRASPCSVLIVKVSSK